MRYGPTTTKQVVLSQVPHFLMLLLVEVALKTSPKKTYHPIHTL